MNKNTYTSIQQIEGKYIRPEKRKELNKIPDEVSIEDKARAAAQQTLKKIKENIESQQE